jgi:guanylate kinase
VNSPRKRPGQLFTLVGPAGAGKNRLMKYVLERTSLKQLPTATTRPMRPGEQEGREHLFVSRETFQQMIATDQLLEHQVIHENLYGMPRAAVEAALDSGQSIIADIEVLGAERARATYPENVVSIFIQTPSIGTLIERMRERRETEAEIGKRLLRVPMELNYGCNCAYAILNDSFERAAEKLYRIVAAELRGEHVPEQGDPLVPYHYHYEAQIIPAYRDEILSKSAPPYILSASVNTTEEMPHQAALRCLHSELGVTINEHALVAGDKPDGKYLPPVALNYSNDDAGERVDYVYVYCLDERIAAPSGWAWKPVDVLPEAVRSAVMECER